MLADSDEESSSAGSSDEEEQLVADPQGTVGEKGSAAPTEGYIHEQALLSDMYVQKNLKKGKRSVTQLNASDPSVLQRLTADDADIKPQMATAAGFHRSRLQRSSSIFWHHGDSPLRSSL